MKALEIILEQQKALEKMVKSSFDSQEYREDCPMCYAQKQGVFVPSHIHKAVELDEEDAVRIADTIDTEDLGAKADMEWEREKDERLGL